MTGGLGFNGLLWLFSIVRSFSPKMVVESGTFLGGSAWTIRKASPSAIIHSFDVDLSNLLVTDRSILFHEMDWNESNIESEDPDSSLCFFDDHVDQIKRLFEAQERGFKYAIFDDNTPVNCTYLATHGVPTLDFVYDERIDDGDILEWSMLRKRYSYKIDKSYLESARVIIKKIVKVPSLRLVNGCADGYPLTLVEIEERN
jgi:hypothetical protein